MEPKLPLYAGIHKGQRRWLADVSIRAGRTNFREQEEVGPLVRELKGFAERHTEHAHLEERFIHPILAGIMPGCSRRIETEHESQHQDLEDLIKGFEMIQGMSKEHETQDVIGQELYLALNRFIAAYLMHINYEEDYVQQTLLNTRTAEELLTTFQSIIAAQAPPVLMANLKLMISGLNLPEMIGLFTLARSLMPPQAFQQMTDDASAYVEPEKWSVIKARVGID